MYINNFIFNKFYIKSFISIRYLLLFGDYMTECKYATKTPWTFELKRGPCPSAVSRNCPLYRNVEGFAPENCTTYEYFDKIETTRKNLGIKEI